MEQKQQVVSSYVRYKKETPNKQPDMLVPAVLLAAITISLAIMLWQVTLIVGTAGVAGYKLHKTMERRAWLRANGLPVNHWNGKREYV